MYFLLSSDFYCDYLDYKKLILKLQSEKADNEHLINGLISIVSKGKFLDNESSICIDRLKEEFENEIAIIQRRNVYSGLHYNPQVNV